jgi:coproporphyrinogen III oxidase
MTRSIHKLSRQASEIYKSVQTHICAALETIDGGARFRSDEWKRTDGKSGPGGGGLTRILSGGKVLEKAGVNFSAVHGFMAKEFAAKLGVSQTEDVPFFATGVSLVIHPFSPMVPTTHANWRYKWKRHNASHSGGSIPRRKQPERVL